MLFAWSAVIAVLVNPILDRLLIDTVFSWIPAWFFLAKTSPRTRPQHSLVPWLLGLYLNGLVGPIVEELYFRGYLLPRISRLGGWAPLLNAVLFSVYHFFTPWQNIGRIVALLPMCTPCGGGGTSTSDHGALPGKRVVDDDAAAAAASNPQVTRGVACFRGG